MKVTRTSIPNDSFLNTAQINYDFVDSYLGELYDGENKLTSNDMVKAFFLSEPQWVRKLMVLRNKIVSKFGLKISNEFIGREMKIESFRFEPGTQLGLFKVFSKKENEVILGEDDKHLNFRVSLFLSNKIHDSHKKDLIVSTTVKFNNWFGQLYFLPVRPFHKLIVPAMLKGMIRELEK